MVDQAKKKESVYSFTSGVYTSCIVVNQSLRSMSMSCYGQQQGCVEKGQQGQQSTQG